MRRFDNSRVQSTCYSNLDTIEFIFNFIKDQITNIKIILAFLVKVRNQTFYHNLGVLNSISLVPKRNFEFLGL